MVIEFLKLLVCQQSAALISNEEGRVELSGAACYFR